MASVMYIDEFGLRSSSKKVASCEANYFKKFKSALFGGFFCVLPSPLEIKNNKKTRVV